MAMPGIRKVDRQTKGVQADAYDPSGKRHRKNFATEDEALEWRLKIRRGSVSGDVAKVPRLDDAADALIDGMMSGAIRAKGGQPYRRSVIRKYWNCLDTYMLPELGLFTLDRLTFPVLSDHVELLLARPVGTSDRRRTLSSSAIRNGFDPLRVILKRAVARDLNAKNPMEFLELPHGDEKARDRVADPVEAERLVNALLTPRDQALWGSAMYAATRLGELRALRWPRVDFTTGRIHITEAMDDERNVTDPKTKAGICYVPIDPRLRKLLLALRAVTTGTGFVFGEAPEVAFAQSTISRAARAAWKAAGLERITLHECRHSCISTWVASGVNIKVVSTYAGHATVGITLDRYSHLMPDSDDEALARIGAFREARFAASGDQSGDRIVG